MYLEKINEFKPKVLETIQLAEDLSAENTSIMSPQSEAEQKFFEHLNQMTNNEIMILQTLMYIGRDETNSIAKSTFDSYFEKKLESNGFKLGQPINRTIEIQQMTHKRRSLHEYLKLGLQKLSI